MCRLALPCEREHFEPAERRDGNVTSARCRLAFTRQDDAMASVTVEELESLRQPGVEAALHVLGDLAHDVLTIL
jgi:hypothetical protein